MGYTVASLSLTMKTNRGFIHISRDDVSIMLPGGRRRHLGWDSLHQLVQDEGVDYEQNEAPTR